MYTTQLTSNSIPGSFIFMIKKKLRNSFVSFRLQEYFEKGRINHMNQYRFNYSLIFPIDIFHCIIYLR